MIWGRFDKIHENSRLLYKVLHWALLPHMSFLTSLEYIFAKDGGLIGDPGWSIEEVKSTLPERRYMVSIDPDVNDLEQDSSEYSEQEVRTAALDILHSVANAFPEREQDVEEVIRRFSL